MQSVVRASDGVIVEVNAAFLQKLQRTREQVIGKTPMELQSWVDPDRILEFRAKLEAEGRVLNHEVRLRAGDGTMPTVLMSSHRVEMGGVLHYLSAGVDITQRKAAEAKLLERERQLRESEARFAKAFQTSPVLMTIARLEDGKFVEVNPAFMQHIGYDRREIIGRDSRELGLWVDLEARLFQAFHRGGNVRQIPGTGLGLVIVKRCVELHDGHIQYHSAEGRGTTFTVTLPLFHPTKEGRAT